jgi:ferredoxin/flavodoxin---NADP+ reductase
MSAQHEEVRMKDGDAGATSEKPLRVAVVGAGPSGFYAAAHLLATERAPIAVDLYDRLPTPYGLVRAGVAPDHPKIKSVTRAYDKTAEHPRFRFYGHVDVGTDVTRDDLLACYHAVIYAVGTSTDRRLGIPGEDLKGSHAATAFVAWYNGHPDHSGLQIDLQHHHAVIIGNGNVAIDIARMLGLAATELAATDVADHALEALTRSAVRDITILGRRGPAQAAFTNPELLELGDLERAGVEVVSAELDPLSAASLPTADRTTRRNVEIIQEYTARAASGKPATIRLRFLASPVALLADASGHVRAVRIERSEIAVRPDGSLGARGTGDFEDLPAGLVVRAIGYRGVPLPGVPFDEARGVICNDRGRICAADGTGHPGEYVAGWIKRGASGVIGTNKKDARETVDRLLEDHAAGHLLAPARDDVEALIAARAPRALAWAGWQAIDAVERSAGASAGRPRVKLAAWETLRAAAIAQA